mmetsp:Transcript_53007/g.102327  ORF Transcript_53007/g.102327 Transcript_53007/m.102327 type:complete len:214 (-) Transcript_53007:855-1496(-)
MAPWWRLHDVYFCDASTDCHRICTNDRTLTAKPICNQATEPQELLLLSYLLQIGDIQLALARSNQCQQAVTTSPLLLLPPLKRPDEWRLVQADGCCHRQSKLLWVCIAQLLPNCGEYQGLPNVCSGGQGLQVATFDPKLAHLVVQKAPSTLAVLSGAHQSNPGAKSCCSTRKGHLWEQARVVHLHPTAPAKSSPSLPATGRSPGRSALPSGPA